MEMEEKTEEREHKELVLLERVFLRLGSSDTDEQLQSTLQRFLVPTILKSSSEFKSVQDKVVEILTHVSKRLRSRPEILLPMAALLEQFTSSDSAPQVVNFSLVYIKLGFQRLSKTEQCSVLPGLLDSLSGRTSQHQTDSILKLFALSVVHLTIPKDPEGRKVLLGLDKKPEVRTLLATHMQNYLLLPYGQVQVPGRGLAPAGLSWSLLERLTGGDQLYNHENLEKVKLAMVRLLSCELFPPHEAFLPLLVAACDPKTSVVDQADTVLKQILGSVDLERAQLVSQLYTLYQGTSTVLGKRPHLTQSSKPNESRSPASLRVRLRLLPILTKSTAAANTFPSAIQVVFDGLFGDSSNSKLRLQALHFVQHACSKASMQKLKVMGPVLLTGLNKVIDEPTEESNLQVLSYVVIGQLANRIPALFVKDTKELSKIFTNLKKDPGQDLGLAIQECLSLMGAAYREVKGQSALIIEALILENIYSDVVRARQAAVQYAGMVFPFHHVPSRFACMLACGDSQGEIREEGKKGLKLPSPDSVLGSVDPSTCEPPGFCTMTKYLCSRAKLVQESGQMYSTAAGKLPFRSPVLSDGLRFLGLCLSHSAGVTAQQTVLGTSLPVISAYIAKVLESDQECLLQYLDLLKQCLGPAADGVLNGVALECVLVLTAADTSHLISSQLFPDKRIIKKFTYVTSAEIREPAARLYGLLARRFDMPLFLQKVADVLEESSHLNYGMQHGAIATLGHLTAAMVEKLGESKVMDNRDKIIQLIRSSIRKLVDLMETSKFLPIANAACQALGSIFRSGTLPLPTNKEDGQENRKEGDDRESKAGIGGIGTIAEGTREEGESVKGKGSGESLEEVKEGVQVMDIQGDGRNIIKEKGGEGGADEKKGSAEVSMEVDNEEEEEEEMVVVSKAELVNSLVQLSKSSQFDKIKEHVASSLGCLCIGDPAFPLRDAVLEGLYSLREEKAIELQFTVGEALVCTMAGRWCTATLDPWNPHPSYNNDNGGEGVEEAVMDKGLKELLSKFATGTSPVVRQSCCIWLLSILKHAAKHPGIQPHLKSIQLVFMDMLTESSEVTQEVAARGMGLVYDLSESEGREVLVQSLIGTLMEGRKSSAKVTEDTKLFNEGQLGKDPKGGNLSTYKELCSLASDLNKPDLVYKFMSLANHNALWNSKKGAAFGFSNIASQAQEQLSPYLPSIVPRLYRYKYDPNPGIQLAMTSIWSAIIPDSKTVMDKYFQQILADLKTSLASAVWRNRQASCMALSDLLVTRQVGEVAEHIPELWTLVLRVRDDIKESVRKAAEIACKSLHKVTVRACDATTMGKTGEAVMKGVLPVFLEGLVNPSDEIRAICIVSIKKISRNAGDLLKPHVAELIPTLLEYLSSLEPQQLNTYSLMFTSKSGLQEKLDDLRVAATKSSPMMDIIQECMVQVGAEQLPMLVPRLLEVMKKGVGLATKVTAAQLVVSLVSQSRQDLTPFAGKLMTALVNGLSDHNVTVRKACAKSIGHLVKVAKDNTISKMITKLKTKYFEKQDSMIESSAAYVAHAMATHSPDVAKNFSSELLPLIFLAMHAKPHPDEDKEAFEALVSKWKEAWEEVVPGTAAGVRVHLAELVDVVCPALQSRSWPVKAQAAAAIATITKNMGENLGSPHLAVLVTALLEGLQGRIWDGKAVLLQSLATLCKSCKVALLQPVPHQSTTPSSSSASSLQPTPTQIAEAVLAQCKKKDISYKTIAIESAGDIIESLQVDIFSDLWGILPINIPDKEEQDEEDKDRRMSASARLNLQVKSFIAVGQAWPAVAQTQKLHYSDFLKLLCSSLPRNHWTVQAAILTATNSAYTKLKHTSSDEDLETLQGLLLPAVCQCIGDMKYHAIRTGSLQALESIIKYFQGIPGKRWKEDSVKLIGSTLRNVTDQQLKDKAQVLMKIIIKS